MNGLRNKNDGQTFFGILNEKDYTNIMIILLIFQIMNKIINLLLQLEEYLIFIIVK